MYNFPAMDETALRSVIELFNGQLSSLEFWQYLWTAIVIIGCAGELGFVIHAYIDEARTWIRSLLFAVELPEKPSAWKLIFEVLSVVAVVVGISGELYVDWRSGDVQTRLRDANSQLVLRLEQEAGNAKESADKAAEAARIADTASAGAVTKADTAGAKADRARDTAGSAVFASTNALDLATRAIAEARSIAPRDINPSLLSSLKPFGPLRYILRCEGDSECKKEGEVQHFAGVLDLGLELLTWKRDMVTGPLPPVDPITSAIVAATEPGWMVHTGVVVGCSESEAEDSPCASAAHSLVDTLNSQGISTTYLPLLERLPSQELIVDVWQIPSPHDRERIQAVWEQSKQMRAIAGAKKTPAKR